MKTWRLLRCGERTGALNMAIDQALLEAVAAGVSAPVLRLYRWQPAALTLGYFQPAAEVDAEACRAAAVDLVRRPTGGRAVLHDREATYAVIAREELFPGGLLATYRRIALALQRALAAFGLAAELAPGRQRRGMTDGNCFTAPSHWELVCRGCKVAGSAQKRGGGAFLQHGSIPLDLDLERLARLLDPQQRRPPDAAGRLAASIGWLNRWCDPPVTVEAVEEALIAAFAAELGIDFTPDELTAGEWQRAERLVEERYGNFEF